MRVPEGTAPTADPPVREHAALYSTCRLQFHAQALIRRVTRGYIATFGVRVELMVLI